MRLVDGHLSLLQCIDLRLIRVDAGHGVSNRCQAHTSRQSNIASPDNRDVHLFLFILAGELIKFEANGRSLPWGRACSVFQVALSGSRSGEGTGSGNPASGCDASIFKKSNPLTISMAARGYTGIL